MQSRKLNFAKTFDEEFLNCQKEYEELEAMKTKRRQAKGKVISNLKSSSSSNGEANSLQEIHQN